MRISDWSSDVCSSDLLIAHELQLRPLREVADREDGGEDLLQARVAALRDRDAKLKKLVVGGLLDLDQVGHLGHFRDLAEVLADALASNQGIRDRKRTRLNSSH